MAHSIVLTSSMASTNNDAFLYVEGTAKTDLDNGRLVNVDFGKKEVSYASDTTKELFVVTTPEHTRYNGEALTEFYNVKGKKVRVAKLLVGDIFGTDAVVGDVASVEIGTKLTVGAEGKLTAGEGPFVAVDKQYVGATLVLEVRYMG